MQRAITLALPLAMVFDHLATPCHLTDWLTEVLGVGPLAAAPLGIGATFGMTLWRNGRTCAASGELIAYEPPALLGYRLFVGDRIHVVRLSCAASAEGTRLRIQQSGERSPLTVDLVRLARTLATLGRPRGGESREDMPHSDHRKERDDEHTQPPVPHASTETGMTLPRAQRTMTMCTTYPEEK